MSFRSTYIAAVALLLIVALLGACKPKPKNTPVVVRVVRDLRSIYGSEFDRRILEFQGSNPKLASGQAVLISTETGDYKDMLQKQTGDSQRADLVVLDAPEDAAASPTLQVALPQAVNICAGVLACPANVPAIIPTEVTGNSREAAQMFVSYLQKPAPPEPMPPATTTTSGTAAPSTATPGTSTGSTATTSAAPAGK
jgi:hypothetical protein